MDYATLKAELTTDPLGLGYASTLPTSDIATAALINATTGKGAGTIRVPSFSRGELLALLVPLEDQLSSGINVSGAAFSQLVLAKWSGRFDALRSGDPQIPTTLILPLLNSAVADGLTTATYITQITNRVCSRAEILFGAGTVIQHKDISIAVGRWLV